MQIDLARRAGRARGKRQEARSKRRDESASSKRVRAHRSCRRELGARASRAKELFARLATWSRGARWPVTPDAMRRQQLVIVARVCASASNPLPALEHLAQCNAIGSQNKCVRAWRPMRQASLRCIARHFSSRVRRFCAQKARHAAAAAAAAPIWPININIAPLAASPENQSLAAS